MRNMVAAMAAARDKVGPPLRDLEVTPAEFDILKRYEMLGASTPPSLFGLRVVVKE